MNSTKKPQKKSVAQYAPLLLLGTALLSVLLIFGVSFARYIKTQDQTVLLKSQSGTGVYLLQGSGGFSAPGDWVREEEGDGYLLSFRLSNAAAQQSYPTGNIRAQLFVIASVQDNGAAVTLRVGDAVYTARGARSFWILVKPLWKRRCFSPVPSRAKRWSISPCRPFQRSRRLSWARAA